MAVIVVLAALAGAAASLTRWLRVAQREHYLAPGTSRFALRWWRSHTANVALAAAAVIAVGASVAVPAVALVAVVAATAGPLGLSWRGRTSKLVWTRRLRTTAAVIGGLDALAFAAAVAAPLSSTLAAALVALQPLVVDGALAICAPFEARVARRYVQTATAKLRSVAPTTVAITGSYGKTSTKQYVRHLVAATRSVLASPASFNNTNGLARTLNEHLSPGTEVFVAEMGMYGPGEIAAMCAWVKPDIAVICNIGPVHLERVGSLDGIVAAKAEILDGAGIAVLNVDAHGVSALAGRTPRTIRCSASDPTADVAVVAGRLLIGGEDVAAAPTHAQPANLACAAGVAVALDVPPHKIAERLADLPQPEHRHQVVAAASGVTVVDNTFSSNPASATASLALLSGLRADGHRAVVVTPGMVELGPRQAAENRSFAEHAAAVATDLVVVGRTNRASLLAGARAAGTSATGTSATGITGTGTAAPPCAVHTVATRDEAVAWVRRTLGPGDVVLYENDLPDHYP